MNRFPKPLRLTLWCLLAILQLACVPQPTPTPLPTFTPTATPSATPLGPTATLFPSATPARTPTPTHTPVVPVAFRSIQMIDNRTGWAVADVGRGATTRILRTEDGGLSWRDRSPLDGDFFHGYFLDGSTAWAWTTWGGLAFRTLDGGRSWEEVGSMAVDPYTGFVDSQHGWQLLAEQWGLSFRQFDILSFTTTQDGGRTWQETNPPPGWGTAYMAYPSAQTVWAVRAGFAKTIEGVPNLGVPYRIETTFDAGRTWTTRQMPLPAEAFTHRREHEGTYLSGVGNCEFVSPVYNSIAIWKVALTCEHASWMYTTATQGKTWIISPMPAGAYAQLQFVNPRQGWLFVLDSEDDYLGTLYRTSTGGQGWELVKRTGWKHLSLSFVDDQIGWAVACDMVYCYQQDAERALVKTTDGGGTWQVLEPRLVP